jgi:hypothetical protein
MAEYVIHFSFAFRVFLSISIDYIFISFFQLWARTPIRRLRRDTKI